MVYCFLLLGKTEGWRRRGLQSMRWLNSITAATDMNLGKLWEMVRDSTGELNDNIWICWNMYENVWNMLNMYEINMKNSILFLNWGIVALQWYVNFCYTVKWISSMFCFGFPSHLGPYPEHGVEFPELYCMFL